MRINSPQELTFARGASRRALAPLSAQSRWADWEVLMLER